MNRLRYNNAIQPTLVPRAADGWRCFGESMNEEVKLQYVKEHFLSDAIASIEAHYWASSEIEYGVK